MRFSFSASSVWGVSTRFRLQIGMIPRCEQSSGTPQPGRTRRIYAPHALHNGRTSHSWRTECEAARLSRA